MGRVPIRGSKSDSVNKKKMNTHYFLEKIHKIQFILTFYIDNVNE